MSATDEYATTKQSNDAHDKVNTKILNTMLDELGVDWAQQVIDEYCGKQEYTWTFDIPSGYLTGNITPNK